MDLTIIAWCRYPAAVNCSSLSRIHRISPLLLLPCSAMGQAESAQEETLSPLEVTATRLELPLADAPYPVAVTDAREMEEDIGNQKKTGYDQYGIDTRFDLKISANRQLTLNHQDSALDDVWRTHPTIHAESFSGTEVGTDLRRLKDQAHSLNHAKPAGTDLNGAIDAATLTFSFQTWDENGDRVKSDSSRQLESFGSRMWGLTSSLKARSPSAGWSTAPTSIGTGWTPPAATSIRTARSTRSNSPSAIVTSRSADAPSFRSMPNGNLFASRTFFPEHFSPRYHPLFLGGDRGTLPVHLSSSPLVPAPSR